MNAYTDSRLSVSNSISRSDPPKGFIICIPFLLSLQNAMKKFNIKKGFLVTFSQTKSVQGVVDLDYKQFIDTFGIHCE